MWPRAKSTFTETDIFRSPFSRFGLPPKHPQWGFDKWQRMVFQGPFPKRKMFKTRSMQNPKILKIRMDALRLSADSPRALRDTPRASLHTRPWGSYMFT